MTMAAQKREAAQANGQPADAMGLLAALLAVQQEAPTLPKHETGAHGAKYTPLDTLVETVGPILSRHGLIWTTLPCRDEQGEPALRYRLAHVASGEVLEGLMPLMLSKKDSQGMGAAITYARRYSLSAVLNLVADDDDDGEWNRQQPSAEPEERKLPEAKVESLTKIIETAGLADHLEMKLRSFGVDKIADLTVEQGISLFEWASVPQDGGE